MKRPSVKALLLKPFLRTFPTLKLDQAIHRLSGRPASLLMYHGVVRDGTRPTLWTQVALSQFDAQMRFLSDHRPVASLETILDGLRGTRKLTPSTVAVTFDDGFYNNLELALPVLERYNIPATIFVVAGRLDGNELLWTDQIYERLIPTSGHANEHREAAYAEVRKLKSLPDNERQHALRILLEPYGGPPPVGRDHPRRILDVSELERLSKSPLITIGAHGMSHALLTRLSLSAAREEIESSKARLEAVTGRPVELFACPDGAYDAAILALVRNAGFKAAVTAQLGCVRPGDDSYRLRRYPIGSDLSLERFALLLAGLDELVSRPAQTAKKAATLFRKHVDRPGKTQTNKTKSDA